jgi:hypothetical protein
MIMEQKLYARVGRSFKPIPNYVGMYWDGEDWTKEHTKHSIARCYDQNGLTLHMFFLRKVQNTNWYSAVREASSCGGYLPSHAQAALAVERCEELREDNGGYWTRDEYSSAIAWYWRWASSYSFALFYATVISQRYCARIFFDTIIKL